MTTVSPINLRVALTGEEAEAADDFRRALGSWRSVAVAFSGGVDSSVATALSARWLGPDRVVAVLGVSPSLSRAERSSAQETAADLGVRLVEVMTYEMQDPGYVANRGDRCYFCKHELYSRAFLDAVETTACDAFLNGDTADDHVRDDRPGRRAALELGVRAPLATAGIDKNMVRRLARALGLPVWDKPSAPCLASRVPVDTPVTRRGLAQIEQAEAGLRALGLRELRVRHLGSRARVELGPDDLPRVHEMAFHHRVLTVVRGAGYDDVTVAQVPLRRD